MYLTDSKRLTFFERRIFQKHIIKVQRGLVFFERRAFQKHIKNNELSFLESTKSNFDLINVRLHTKSTQKNRVK